MKRKFLITCLVLATHLPLYSQLPVDKWTPITIDTSRQTWGVGKYKWVRGFGVDAYDANRHGLKRVVINPDGYRDIIAGWYYYRNPGGDMTGEWERYELNPKADGILFTNVNDDEVADIIAVAGQDVYWFEVLNQYHKMFKVHKVGQIKPTDHLNGQGYLIADVIKGGKPEVLIAGGEGIYMAEIPEHPDSVQWNFILIAETISSEGFDAVDIDGDGDLDIVCGKVLENEKAPLELKCYENPGKKSEKWSGWKIGSTIYPIDRIKSSDLNNDGIPEIIVTEERWNVIKPIANLWVFSMSSKKNLQKEWKRKSLASHYSLNNLDLSDIDRDGDIDIITNEHKGPDLKTFLYINDGSGEFIEKEIFKGVEMHLGAKLVDLDNDGDLDIIGPAWDRSNVLTVIRNDAIQKKEIGKPWLVVYDDTCTVTEKSRGFYRFQPSLVGGKNWKEPFDFYNGTFYGRYEVLDYPSDEPFKLSFCIWAEVEKGDWKEWKETCSPKTVLNGRDKAVSVTIPSQNWWKKDVPVDFENVNNFRFMGVVVWCKNSRNCSNLVKPSESCWDERKDIYPFRLRFSLIAVAEGESFKDWDEYIDLERFNQK